MSSSFQPNWVSAPGETIMDILHERNISVSSFSEETGIPSNKVKKLLHGELDLTEEIAIRLQNSIGGSVLFWIQRESQYRQDCERLSIFNEIIDNQAWLKGLPLKDMITYGWINSAEDKLSACLDFFDVPDISSWQEKYENLLAATSFRTTQTFASGFGPTAAWLRQGEKIGMSMQCKDWNADLFEDSLDEIRGLSRKKNLQEFLPELKKMCADAGVALAIARTPTGCRASGATQFITDNKALLLLSFRYLSDDQFWFTFFHEVGHLLLHGKNLLFIESVSEKSTEMLEEEANAFAAEALIPSHFEPRLKKLHSNKRDIIAFASEIGVSPGIVIGQMQYRGIIDFKYLNSFKRRYNWDDIPV